MMKEQERKEAKAPEMREEEEEEETQQEGLEAKVDVQAAEGTILPGQIAEGTKLPGTTDPAQESTENQTRRRTSQIQGSMAVLEKKKRQDDIIVVHL